MQSPAGVRMGTYKDWPDMRLRLDTHQPFKTLRMQPEYLSPLALCFVLKEKVPIPSLSKPWKRKRSKRAAR